MLPVLQGNDREVFAPDQPAPSFVAFLKETHRPLFSLAPTDKEGLCPDLGLEFDGSFSPSGCRTGVNRQK